MRPKSAGIMLIVAILLGISGTASAATFKMAVGDAQGGTQWELASFFKQSLERKTQGVHRVALFPNGQLGSEEDTVNEAAMGTLDMSVLALPYIVRNADEARTLVQGEIGRELVDNTVRDAQVRIVGWAFSGFRVLTNSRKPVMDPGDLSGMVIRVPKNEVMIETYQAWGINPSPLAWSETFTALQQKVVDGQDNPFITVAAMKFDEVQKYITPIRYLFSLEPLVISEEVFQHQTPAMQDAILAAGREATAHSYDYLQRTEREVRQQLQAKGMEIVEPAGGEEAWAKVAMERVWPRFYDTVGGKEKIDATQRALGR